MKASVIIASHNKLDYLVRTLACLTRQTTHLHEIIVVDDASSPALEWLPGAHKVIRRNGSRHVQAARNLGCGAATGDLLLFLDDDCLVRGDWAASHMRRHEEYPKSLVVGSTRRVDFRGRRAFWELPTETEIADHRCFQRSYELLRAGLPPWNLAPASNNASVLRADFLEAGGYDEAYVGWGVDDVDLTFRLLSQGLQLIIDPGPMVYHLEHPRNSECQSAEERENLAVFARKHGFWAYGPPSKEWVGPRRFPPGFCGAEVDFMAHPDHGKALFVSIGQPLGSVRSSVSETWVLGREQASAVGGATMVATG